MDYRAQYALCAALGSQGGFAEADAPDPEEGEIPRRGSRNAIRCERPEWKQRNSRASGTSAGQASC
jgi:hypothetical protein